MGSSLVDEKDKVFQCLNNQMRGHRVVLIERMTKSDKIWPYGIVSSKPGTYGNKHSSPLIKVDDVTEDGTERRFGLQTQFSNKCYVDVVTETSFDTQFRVRGINGRTKPFFLEITALNFGVSRATGISEITH